MFDADGSVQGTQEKGVSVRLTQIDLGNLEAVQRMLQRLGIVATIYRDRRPEGMKTLPDGKGGAREYACQALHELIISGENLVRYAELIGFADSDKMDRLNGLLGNYQRKPNAERFAATVQSLEDDGVEDVYDVTVADVHAFDANGLYVHNCAEQPLPPYGCCCLGSIDLTRMVKDPFAANASFDQEPFKQLVRTAVRMLDNVLDVTAWPLPEQQQEAHNKRRIGLGFTGLGDTLVMLGLRYDTDAARAFARDITRDDARRGLPRLGGTGRRSAARSRCWMPTSTWPRRASRRACPSRSRTGSANTASATATCCRSRRPARSRWRSPTTPRTASSRRSRGSTRARSAWPRAAPRITRSKTTPGACTSTSAATWTSCRRRSSPRWRFPRSTT